MLLIRRRLAGWLSMGAWGWLLGFGIAAVINVATGMPATTLSLLMSGIAGFAFSQALAWTLMGYRATTPGEARDVRADGLLLQSADTAAAHGVPRRRRGVGGWLRLLVVYFLGIGPLFAIGSTLRWIGLIEQRELMPLSGDAWRDCVLAFWGVTGGAIFLSVIAGMFLVRAWIPRSITVAISALWIIGPIKEALCLVIIPTYFLGQNSDPVSQTRAIAFLASSLIVACIWHLYLLSSERVRCTYHIRTPNAPT